MFIQESGKHGRGSKVKIKSEHVVYSFMGMPRIYESIKIFQFIVLVILFYIV